MEIPSLDSFCVEDQDIAQTVYDSLMCDLVPGYELPWVEPIFVPGHPCHEEYRNMLRAYDRLLKRLNQSDEDGDVEDMIHGLLSHGRIAALEMFRYGRAYQKMLDSRI